MVTNKEVLEIIRGLASLSMKYVEGEVELIKSMKMFSKLLPEYVGKQIRDAIDIGLPSVKFVASRFLHMIEKGEYDYV